MSYQSWIILFYLFTAASYLGCWKINLGNLSIPSIEGKYPDLTDNYQARTAAVRKCADVASVKGYTVFALFDFGMCLTGPNAVKAFSQYGPSTDCGYRGKGGSTGISVYSFQKGNSGINCRYHSHIFFKCLSITQRNETKIFTLDTYRITGRLDTNLSIFKISQYGIHNIL